MKANYEKGAVHNDHHKEINIQAAIMTEESLAKLITDFMGGEDMRTDKAPDAGFVQDAEAIVSEKSSANDSKAEDYTSGDCTSGDCTSETIKAAEPSLSYPPITEAQERFFEKWGWVVIDKMTGKITENTTGDLEKTEEKKKVDVKLEELMHSIYDYTHQYDWNPEDTSSVHRWRMLYDLLGKQKFFKEGERKRYRSFVDVVVRYCYPEVKNTYNDNLRQTALPESFHDWAKEDWEEYRRLKAIILA